jgi:hypothetical protein
VSGFDFPTWKARAAATSCVDGLGLSLRWRVAAWHFDDATGALVTIGAALEHEPYRERTIWVCSAGTVTDARTDDGRGNIVAEDGRRLWPVG